ncbi:MAG: FtsX-like permease family protein [Candidatus Odinarchaeota archaeon]
MGSKAILLRWSFRDLKQRKIQVLAIIVIIGLGTGVYTGLSSTTPWRWNAFNSSNEVLRMFDLKISLLPGSWIKQDDFSDIITNNLAHGNWIDALEYRLTFPTTVNASTTNQTILVNGRIIGINVTGGSDNLNVNKIHITNGRHLLSTETRGNVCLLEHNFASYYDLKPDNQSIKISGGHELSFVGSALTPEFFMVIEENLFMAQSSFCALFIPMETAQSILQQSLGLPIEINFVNELLLSLTADADINVLKTEIEEQFELYYPQIDFNFIEREDQPSYKTQEEDIPGDQAMYYIFSFLILIIAAFGTYNLISRVVNSQRRQIGINMGLGVTPRKIAYRYLIFSLEIAVGGVIVGYFFAIIFGSRLGDVIKGVTPYPVWEEWLVTDLFVQGTLLGIIIPFLASIIPIIQASRMEPINAIQTGAKLGTGKGFRPLLARLKIPGSIFTQMPFRNISRNLKRTISTFMGIALAICVLIAVFSFVDGATLLLDSEQRILKGDSEGRVNILLNNFYNASLSPVTNITTHSKIEAAVPMIQVPVKIYGEQDSFGITLECFDLSNPIWTPVTSNDLTAENLSSGIIISKETARDLKVKLGDEIILEHPFRESNIHYSKRNTTFDVIGIQNSEVRFWVFLDSINSPIFNFTDFTNSIMVIPKEGVTEAEIQTDLFPLPGYNGIQSITKMTKVYEELIEMFRSIFDVLQYVVLLLALLIVYNTTSVNIDERTRELATMGAFGTPIRTSIRILMVESLIMGVLGTIFGFFGFGPIVINILQIRVSEAMDEVHLAAFLYPDSLFMVLGIGIVLVTLIPLLSVRKLTRMDLPSALRVVE